MEKIEMKEEPLMHRAARAPRRKPSTTYSRSPSFCKSYGLWICLFCVGISIAVGGTILAVKLSTEKETNKLLEAITLAPIEIKVTFPPFCGPSQIYCSDDREEDVKIKGREPNSNGENAETFAKLNGESTQIEPVVMYQNPCGNQTDQELLTAAEEGSLEDILELMRCPDVDFNAKNEKGMTPLYLASLRGHAEVVRALVRVPAVRDSVNEPVVAQWTPLQSAASSGFADVIEALLTAPGIDVNARFKACHY